jgi:hypothetical protein
MKAHLLTSEFPIVSNQNQTADCGKEILSAQTVFMWDEAAMCEGLSYGKNVCAKCQFADKGPRGKMMVYGITERKYEQSTDTTDGEACRRTGNAAKDCR